MVAHGLFKSNHRGEQISFGSGLVKPSDIFGSVKRSLGRRSKCQCKHHQQKLLQRQEEQTRVGSTPFFLLLTGILNWIRDEQVFHVCMVQGAASMMLSAACVTFSDMGASVFRLLAYHCYLLEGFYMLRLRRQIQPLQGLDTLSYVLWMADSLFGVGSIIGVVLAYLEFFQPAAQFDLNVVCGRVVLSCFWVLSAALCLVCTIVLSRKQVGGSSYGGGGASSRLPCCEEEAEERGRLAPGRTATADSFL